MANIKSAVKRIETTNRKTEENKSIKSKVATYVKKFKASVAENRFDDAKALLNTVFALIDSACSKNIIHKNTASRKKASLSKMLFVAQK